MATDNPRAVDDQETHPKDRLNRVVFYLISVLLMLL